MTRRTARGVIFSSHARGHKMREEKGEKCPNCGRRIGIGRPECIYCGYQLPLDDKLRKELKKKLVDRVLGKEEALDIKGARSRPAKCPACGAGLKPDQKFCTECGRKIFEGTPPETEDAYQPPEPAPPEEAQDFTPPLITFDIQEYRSGFQFTPDNTLWMASLLVFLFSITRPFGMIPPANAHSYFRAAEVIPAPTVLWFGFALCFIFAYLANANVLHIADRKKGLKGIFIIVVLVTAAVGRGIFFTPSAFIVMTVFFIAAYFRSRETMPEYTTDDYFWTTALQTASLTLFVLLMYSRVIILSGTPHGLISNPGFSLQVLAVILLLIGVHLRKKRLMKRYE